MDDYMGKSSVSNQSVVKGWLYFTETLQTEWTHDSCIIALEISQDSISYSNRFGQQK